MPVRQFVLSLPHELRILAAFKPDVLTALSRLFVEEVFRSYRQRAERLGIADGQGGAITLVPTFHSSPPAAARTTTSSRRPASLL